MFLISKNTKTIKIKTFQHFNVNSVVHKTIGRGYCCRYFQLIIQEVSILKRQLIDIFFSATSCGTFLTGPSGTVKSSNYPSNYNDNEYCTWQIQVPVNKKIRLDFTEFKTETGKDFLMIYDTNHFDRPNIIFDGTTYKPPPFTSSGNVLRVRFISDGANAMKGFSFNYKQVGKM